MVPATALSLESQLRGIIPTVNDFPKPGIAFKDISPLLASPALFNRTIEEIGKQCRAAGATHIAALESRGFLFGMPTAARIGIPFLPVRKPGKLPGEVIEVNYELEYGSGKLQMQRGAVPADARVVIVDDLLATGGTAKGAAELIEKSGGSVAGVICVIELKELKGRQKLSGLPVSSLIQY